MGEQGSHDQDYRVSEIYGLESVNKGTDVGSECKRNAIDERMHIISLLLYIYCELW